MTNRLLKLPPLCSTRLLPPPHQTLTLTPVADVTFLNRCCLHLELSRCASPWHDICATLHPFFVPPLPAWPCPMACRLYPIINPDHLPLHHLLHCRLNNQSAVVIRSFSVAEITPLSPSPHKSQSPLLFRFCFAHLPLFYFLVIPHILTLNDFFVLCSHLHTRD